MGERILVTGNLGYIGSQLAPSLQASGYEVQGMDIGFFVHNALPRGRDRILTSLTDIRSCETSDFEGFSTVIHLAALSNDPLGEINPGVTREINHEGTLRVAQKAKHAGVSKFIFFSTQSVYGHADTSELVSETSATGPITEYAASKLDAENSLRTLASHDFKVLAFRPSTLCGWSTRFRSDIVLNNFVLTALMSRRIVVKSDGTPWRPVLDMRDAIEATKTAVRELPSMPNFSILNLGPDGGNYQVSELAAAVQAFLPGISVEFSGEHSDPRSYRVSFDALERSLGIRLSTSLESSIEDLISKLSRYQLPANFGNFTTRLETLRDQDLRRG